MIAVASAAPLVREFDAVRAGLPGQDCIWLGPARSRGLEDFSRHGFPTPRLEEWKFTNLGGLAKQTFDLAVGGAAAALDPSLLLPNAHRLVFAGGRFQPALSDAGALPAGLTLTNLATLLEQPAGDAADWFAEADREAATSLVSLNTALMSDGAVLRIGHDVQVERPIQLIYLGQGGAAVPALQWRNLIVAEPGSRATIVETYAGSGRYWTNAVSEIRLGEGATLSHYKLQTEDQTAFHTSAARLNLATASQYRSFTLSTGALLARTEIDANFAGERVVCHLDGLCLVRDSQHSDFTTRIDHARPGGSSGQVYKTVVDDKAHSVFQGRVRVSPQAQKTEARQLNRNLLLADGAQADSKPELEILADDVVCSHGATVGDLDRNALFYLQARGLDEVEARALLVQAFAAEAVDRIEVEAVRAYFAAPLGRWLGQ